MLLNGSKSLTFFPSRAIRQGDTLSPYLFILCSEVLAGLINKEVERGIICGVKIAPSTPCISKLLYADDVLLLFGAKIAEVNKMMECVKKYCAWFGQSISRDKCGVFVSKGVHAYFCCQLKTLWGFKPLPKDVKYLGLPLLLLIESLKDFSFVKDRLETTISGWKGKCLSWMGCGTLIKFVAQSIPIYAMSAFKLPKSLCGDLDSLVRKFWWSPTKKGNRFYTPMSWSKLCRSLSAEGLGFQSL